MEWSIIGLNFLYAALGVVLMYVSYRTIDKLTPEVNFAEELRKGNVAVAIFIAALFVSIALIIRGAPHCRARSAPPPLTPRAKRAGGRCTARSTKIRSISSSPTARRSTR